MTMLELRCSRDLAMRLGAIVPESIEHHRHLRDLGLMLVRDPEGEPLFWPQQLSPYAVPIKSS